MKKQLFFVALLATALLACSKKDDNTIDQQPANGESTTVFYADTFRIYSTDLKGGNRKLVVDEDLKSGNNYLGYVTYVAVSKKLAYTYYEGYNKDIVLKTCNVDGSDKKTIKTFPASTNVGVLKGTSDGQLIYSLPGNVYPNQTPSKTFSMKVDGSGETEIKIPFYANIHNPDLISSEGKGILDESGYFAIIANGIFDERNSFNILLNEDNDKTKIRSLTLSNDATKAAFVQTTTTNRKYEIRIKDVKSTAPSATILYTVNIAADANDQAPDIHFVNGTKNLLMEYGKFTSPKGSSADYTYCELIDTATGKVTQSWKFTGDSIGRLTTD